MPHYSSDNQHDVINVTAVFLNGEEVKGVFEADTDEGYITVARKRPDGRICIEDDEIQRDRIYGAVEVNTKDEPNA